MTWDIEHKQSIPLLLLCYLKQNTLKLDTGSPACLSRPAHTATTTIYISRWSTGMGNLVSTLCAVFPESEKYMKLHLQYWQELCIFSSAFQKANYFMSWKSFCLFLNKLSLLFLQVCIKKVIIWKYYETSGITPKSFNICFWSGLWNTALSACFPISIICLFLYLILLLEVYEI